MRQFVAAACFLCAGGSILAQPQSPPPFKSGVTLVTIDVTVFDADGFPVPGLTAADFEVRLNGRVQAVRALTYVQAAFTTAGAPMAGAVGPAFDASPVPTTPASSNASRGSPRVFVIFVDDLSFASLRGKSLVAAARRFAEGLPPSDVVGLATSSGTRAVNPTRDRAAVGAALDAIVGEFGDPAAIDRSSPLGGANAPPDQSVGIGQSLDIDRGDVSALKEAIARECFNGSRTLPDAQSLGQVIANNQCASAVQGEARRTAALTKQTTARQVQAYQSVIRAMAGASGIKHLLVLTDGLGISQDTATVVPVARAAAEAGVQMSVMIEEDPGATKRRREDSSMFASGAQTVADMVGGAFYRVTGTPDPFFRRVATAASAVYRLSVELASDATAGQDIALAVKVRRPGLSAHANRHAIAPSAAADAAPAIAPAAPLASPAAAAAPPMSLDDQLRAAIATGQTKGGVPIALAKALRRAQDPAQVDVGVRIDVPATVKGPLTAMFGLVDDTGTIRTAKKTIDAPSGAGYAMTFSIPVTPGRYRLRFAVADADGAVGALESIVKAQLTAMGPLTASDLLLSTIDAKRQEQAAPAAEELPAAAKTLSASLELYPVAGAALPGDVLVKLALVAAGQQQPEIERIVTPENVDGTLRADAEFPVERLAAGTYSVQATVLVGANTIGTTSTTIRK
jgi:VWFA-related protein